MPHLRFDHSPGLGQIVDLPGFAEHMRAAMVATGLFPLGGIRVRGHAAGVQAVADGAPHWHWLDMELRLGAGRSEADRARAPAPPKRFTPPRGPGWNRRSRATPSRSALICARSTQGSAPRAGTPSTAP